MSKRKKHAGGRPSQGLTEDTAYVRGPATLIQAMRERAEELGVTVAEVWREAAEMYLERKR